MSLRDEEQFSDVEIIEATAVDAPRASLATREAITIALLVAWADITLYRGHGFAGVAAMLALAPLLLLAGSPRVRFALASGLLLGMLWLLACRLVWCGSLLQVAGGAVLLLAFSASLAGLSPGLVPLSLFASQILPAGYRAFAHYGKMFQNYGPKIPRTSWLNVALPLAAFVAFSMLFVLANPDMVTFLGRKTELFLQTLRNWIVNITLRPTEVIFWFAVAWIAAGLLRPIVDEALLRRDGEEERPEKAAPAPLYTACRNTLITVILLFACYLVFEFKTLWFRKFPEGFYYAGYAHEGAAWLTVALALATFVLSIVFRGPILQDPQLSNLRRLAWIWSVQNVLLAVAVYNRLLIYVGFNGMTYMRIVGFFGISAVVAGFVLVVWKIARQKDFAWLVRRQIWALALTIYLFALTPVDRLAVSYNVRRIMGGDPAACMQIGVQRVNVEGVLAMTPLLDCRDEEVRRGVAALIAQRVDRLENRQRQVERLGWTAWQWADQAALRKLNRLRDHWRAFESRHIQEEALTRFHDYAYQWY
jgi:hypothetical protein